MANNKNERANAYDQIAASADYQKNGRNLRLIQGAVVTASAISTGFTNAFAHAERIGVGLACILALLVVFFAEKFYFTLRHGLTTVYQAGKQRFYAMICYRIIQGTMILNAGTLCAYIVGFPIPTWLEWWNHWSIIVHFALALIGVQLVRDSDSVVENRILELKVATAKQDLVTARKSALIGSPLVLFFAKLRGFLESISASFRILFRRGGLAKAYIEEVERENFDSLAPKSGRSKRQTRAGSRRPANRGGKRCGKQSV
jgi:hypothetical protein